MITPEFVAAFDRTKLSDRDAVHVVTSVVQALDIDPTPFYISRTTIQRCRKQLRKAGAEKLKANFKNSDLSRVTIHWMASTSPNVENFKRYRESWSKLDHSKFKPGINDKTVKKIMETDRSDIIKFVNETLKIQQPRVDYEEFLLLTLLFLGEPLPPKKSICAPGAFHHARWMAKAIYTLKIFLLRDNFRLTRNEKINLRALCIFIVKLYLKKWFSAPLSTKAPAVDLNLCKAAY